MRGMIPRHCHGIESMATSTSDFSEPIYSTEETVPHQFLLHPTDISLRISPDEMNLSSGNSYLLVNLTVSKIQLSLSDHQLKGITALATKFENYSYTILK